MTWWAIGVSIPDLHGVNVIQGLQTATHGDK